MHQGNAAVALAVCRALTDEYVADLANLLANQDYAHQVSAFVQQSYEGSETPEACSSVVASAHGYAREALESVASHVLNCAQKLTDLLHLHEAALGDIEGRVQQVQSRIQRAQKAHTGKIIQASCRPKQILGKCRIRVQDDSLSPLNQAYERCQVDYSQFDGVGMAFNVTSDFSSNPNTPSGADNGSLNHSLSSARPSLSVPGPPPSLSTSAPGPPPAITTTKRHSTNAGKTSVSPLGSVSGPVPLMPPKPPSAPATPSGSVPPPPPPPPPVFRPAAVSPLSSGSFPGPVPPVPPPIPKTPLSSSNSQPIPPPLPRAPSLTSPLSAGSFTTSVPPTPPPLPRSITPTSSAIELLAAPMRPMPPAAPKPTTPNLSIEVPMRKAMFSSGPVPPPPSIPNVVAPPAPPSISKPVAAPIPPVPRPAMPPLPPSAYRGVMPSSSQPVPPPPPALPSGLSNRPAVVRTSSGPGIPPPPSYGGAAMPQPPPLPTLSTSRSRPANGSGAVPPPPPPPPPLK